MDLIYIKEKQWPQKSKKKKKSTRKTGNQPNNKMSFATDIPIPLFYLGFYFVLFFLKEKKISKLG